MGRRGPLPKSSFQLRLAGSPLATARAAEEAAAIAAAVDTVPPPPDRIAKNKLAVKIFTELATDMVEKRLLAKQDFEIIALMAHELATVQRANDKIDKEGEIVRNPLNGIKGPNPWVSIRNTATVNAAKCSAQLHRVTRLRCGAGATPSAGAADKPQGKAALFAG